MDYIILFIKIINKKMSKWGLGIGDWGLGFGVGGLGIGDWGLGPIPNPQSPIPNPQSPIPFKFNIIYYLIKINKLNNK